ncbi:6-phosphofructokinase [candidate division WOR-1 bacterium DG_54_3]|uniref:ATP-dependent 6-phosphofructokinase n=1 Tax=candidate division WOR-1 bacterium DG_54_3 TaxID=1703775 RepID=A0A0S7XSC3_UNCSA|nr:MAG: 6-phosphofructokinase [candidate division WOR-1 bacterium DG_54_3]
MKSIAVVTPGGDAPGMNTAIRAVVRTAIFHGLRVWGIERGWYGLINGLLKEMGPKSVSGIVNKGGTELHTRRCPEFNEKKYRIMGHKELKLREIDGMIVIGGDGSLRAAHALQQEFGIPINVIPATIDNDIPCTDFTIGFDTAVNTALEAIDKIRDTATSHERLFVVEVMGRRNGFIALDVGLSAGAEAILIPEQKYDLEKLSRHIRAGQERGKESFIIVAAEGAGNVHKIAQELRDSLNIEVRLTILGHVQRGGTPTSLSRELACKLGAAAVENMIAGKHGYLVGAVSDKVSLCPIGEVIKTTKKIDLEQLRIANMLAT